MRRLVVVLLLSFTVVFVSSRPAAACSCAAPTTSPGVEFEGVALGRAGDGWVFDVTRVERGDVGRRAVVGLDVDDPDANWADSCSLGAAPRDGNRYRVVATAGRESRLTATLCGGGVLQLLELAPRDWTPPRDVAGGPAESSMLPGAAVLLLAVVAVGRRLRPAGAASPAVPPGRRRT